MIWNEINIVVSCIYAFINQKINKNISLINHRNKRECECYQLVHQSYHRTKHPLNTWSSEFFVCCISVKKYPGNFCTTVIVARIIIHPSTIEVANNWTHQTIPFQTVKHHLFSKFRNIMRSWNLPTEWPRPLCRYMETVSWGTTN